MAKTSGKTTSKATDRSAKTVSVTRSAKTGRFVTTDSGSQKSSKSDKGGKALLKAWKRIADRNGEGY